MAPKTAPPTIGTITATLAASEGWACRLDANILLVIIDG